MSIQRINSHSVSRLSVHIVWKTNYRYSVFQGDIKLCCRQICESEDIGILKGVVSKDNIHIEYCLYLCLSDLIKKLKGSSSRKLQMDF